MKLKVTIILSLLLSVSLASVAQKPQYKVLIKLKNTYYIQKSYLTGLTDSTIEVSGYSNGQLRYPRAIEVSDIEKIIVKRKGGFAKGFLFFLGSGIVISITTWSVPAGYITYGIFYASLTLPVALVAGGIGDWLSIKKRYKLNRDQEYYLKVKPELEKYLVNR